MNAFIATSRHPAADPYVKAARQALQRLSQCAAFHGHASLISAGLRHDIELMAANRDIKKICLNFVDRAGRVIVGPYVTTVTAQGYRLAVPMQRQSRISLGGSGQPRLVVYRNGHERAYQHLLRLAWPASDIEPRRYDGVVTAIRADGSGTVADRLGHTAYLPRGENHGFRRGQAVSYTISRNRMGVVAGDLRPATGYRRAA